MNKSTFAAKTASFAAAALLLSGICPAAAEEAPNLQDSLRYAFPSVMRGIEVTPTVDYVCGKPDGSGYTEGEVISEINSLCSRAAALSANSIIINTSLDELRFYEGGSPSLIDYTVENALKRGFYVYVGLDIGTAGNAVSATPAEKLDNITEAAERLARSAPDGIILSGYDMENSPDSYADYIRSGSVCGYERWLSEYGEYLLSQTAAAVRKASDKTALGVEISSQSTDHGYIDITKDITGIKSDFVLLDTENGLLSEEMPFEEAVSAWNDICADNNIRLLVSHANDLTATGEKDWYYPDELVKQVMKASEYSSCRGSVFRSLSALEADTGQSTEVLLKYYNDGLDPVSLDSQLQMTLPHSNEFRTEDDSVIFSGSFDPNFDVYFCGERIELNAAGRFYFNMPLDVGENKFTFVNKGRSVTYNITRTIRVLKSAYPTGEAVYLDGGAQLDFSAVAYRGAEVTANINGKTIRLTESAGLSDVLDPNSSYAMYEGSYTIPDGSTADVTDLGEAAVYAKYTVGGSVITERISCSRIYINKKPEPVNQQVQPLPQLTEGDSLRYSSGNVITISNDNTMCWSGANTLTVPQPDCSRLPAGTRDYLEKRVTYSGTSYYLTKAGRRIRVNDAALSEEGSVPGGSVGVVSGYTENGDTVLVFELPDKNPFNITYSGIYGTGGFSVSSFDPVSISVVFDYVSQITTGDMVFPADAVFSRGSWRTEQSGGISRGVLTLELSHKGAYDGFSSAYDRQGRLVMRFNGIERSLEGARIVIDPGHGYVGGGKFDPGAVRHIREQEANLAISKLVEQKLTAYGAEVIRFPTETTDYVTAQRGEAARQYDPDLFIAIHCNSGASENAAGGEAYYFMPFSQPLADRISARLGQALTIVHGDSRNYDRGEKYNYFYVTQQQEFPSVLIETAFVSNYTEAMALAAPAYQDIFAQAIADGIRDYIMGR